MKYLNDKEFEYNEVKYKLRARQMGKTKYLEDLVSDFSIQKTKISPKIIDDLIEHTNEDENNTRL